MSILHLALLASSVTLVPTPSDEPRQARVAYSDLNLWSSSGRDNLDRRLKLALNMVCGRTIGKSLDEQLTIRKCQKRAKTEIDPQREIAIARTGVKLASGF